MLNTSSQLIMFFVVLFLISVGQSWALHDDESARRGSWKTDNVSPEKPKDPDAKQRFDKSLDKVFQKSPITIPPQTDNVTTGPEAGKSSNKRGNVIFENKWKFFKGQGELPRDWHQRGFDDSTWQEGLAGFGYGTGKPNTLLSDMQGNYSSVYLRRGYFISDYNKITRITLSLICDGPFVAYINGIDAIRSRKPQSGDPLDLSGFIHELDNGKNVFAITCSNDDISSNDYSFVPNIQIESE